MARVIATILRFDSHYFVVGTQRVIQWLMRFLVVAVLIFSAWQKSSVGQELIIPVAELSLAAWLVSGFAMQASFITVAIVFSAFAGVHLKSMLFTQSDCGCMGNLKIASEWMMALNLGVVVSAVFVASKQFANVRSVSNLCITCVAATLVAAFVSSSTVRPGVANASEYTIRQFGTAVDVGILDPEAWIGQRLPLLECLPKDSPLNSGLWELVIVQPGCSKCDSFLRSRSFRQALQGQWQQAVVSLGSTSYSMTPFQNVPAYQANSCSREWFGVTPIVLRIRDGVVVMNAGGNESGDVNSQLE